MLHSIAVACVLLLCGSARLLPGMLLHLQGKAVAAAAGLLCRWVQLADELRCDQTSLVWAALG